MAPPTRGRRIGAVAISAALHTVVLTAIAVYVPKLAIPPEDAAPPQPIIPVLLTPRLPPRRAGEKPAPIRLHHRPQRFPPAPIAPLPVPPAAPPRPAGPGAVALHPAPLPEGPKGEVREALRRGTVGCANADAVGLTKAERDFCNEQLGKGAKTAPFLGLGIAADKQAAFDRAAARKEADRRYRDAPALPGTEPMTGSPEPWRIPTDPR